MRAGVQALLATGGIDLVAVSSLYTTRPLGGAGRQPAYLNAAICVESRLSPGQLLRLLKRIERKAGRRPRGLDAARPLDLDVIDMGGRRIGGPRASRPSLGAVGRGPRGWLTLPHPEMHKRLFVLEPLAEIAPHWFHPVYRVPVVRLLERLSRPPGSIRRTLDSQWLSCDKVN